MGKSQQLWFARWGLALITVLFMTATPFAQDSASVVPELAITEQPAAISIAEKDKPVTITFAAQKGEETVSYQWFQSADGTTENAEAIEGANESSFSTDVFTEKGIRYYFCVATAGEESVTSDVAAVAYTGLPVLYINTEIPMEEITKEEYVFGDIKLVYEDGTDFTYTFEKIKDGEKKEGIKGRGNSTWQMAKKGYAFKFDSKQSFFGLAAAKKWCIIANYADKTLLRNVYASLLANELFDAEWNPSFRSVDVVWHGVYQGKYILCERNTVSAGRVEVQDISDYSAKNIEKGKYVDQNDDGVVDLYDGGFILEIDDWKDAEFWFETEKEKAPVAMKDPDEVSEEIQNHVQALVQTAENSLYAENFKDTTDGWRKYFDEKSVIDWFFVNEIARNHDAKDFSSIYKFYSPADGKLHYGPIWDFDVGFGNDGEGQVAAVTGWYVKNGFWTARMFEDSLFVANVINRWNEKKEALYASVETFLSKASNDSISAECNFMKWDVLGKDIYHNSAGFEERLTYQSEVEYMKDWVEDRIAWIDNALNNSFFISYDLDGGTLATPNRNVFLSEDTEPFTLNNPTKEGFVFAGWTGTGIEGLSESVEVTDDGAGNKSFKANWKVDISTFDVSFAQSDLVYSGAAQTPDVVVSQGETVLVANTDYVVSFADNLNAGEATVTITGIGNYVGELEKTFTIAPKPVTLTVADTSKMFGESDPEFGFAVEGLVERDGAVEELKDVELAREEGEDLGEYAISAVVNAESNPNYAVTVENGKFTIAPNTTEIVVTIIGHKDSVVYDGEEHSVSGFDMVSSVEAYSVDFVTYNGDSAVAGADAKIYSMGLADSNFANTSVNYTNVTFAIDDGKLEVLPKPVSLTIANASKTYGEEDPEFTYTTEGLLTFNEVEDSLKNVTLTREEGTDAGEYAITANVDADSNANYAVKVNNGVFTINPDTTKVVVTIKGHVDTLTFNGKNQSVHGFDFASSNEAYTLDFVNFTGDSVATGKDAKQFTMELADTNFKNVSVNYSNVEFNVKNGNLVILPKPVTLTVANVSKTYGDKDPELTYTVEGLVKIDTVQDELKDVTLKRKSGEDVGEYSITASVKGKSNPNYVVSTTKGVFKINPDTTKIVVTIKGHVDTVEYDGKKHTVHGFDFSSDCSSYSIDLVSFGGDSVVSGTKVKTYSMGLTSDQFKNSSANYSNVVFKVKDGNLVIVKPKEQDGLIASPSRATLLRLTTMDRRIQVNSTMMGKPYAVFDMQGVVVQSGRVDAASFEIPVSKSGVYMVRVGSLAQRVNIK